MNSLKEKEASLIEREDAAYRSEREASQMVSEVANDKARIEKEYVFLAVFPLLVSSGFVFSSLCVIFRGFFSRSSCFYIIFLLFVPFPVVFRRRSLETTSENIRRRENALDERASSLDAAEAKLNRERSEFRLQRDKAISAEQRRYEDSQSRVRELESELADVSASLKQGNREIEVFEVFLVLNTWIF